MNTLLEIINFDSFTDWLESFLMHQIIFAPILLLILEESGIPLPIPGDLVIAYMGYQVRAGHISYPAAFLLLLFSVLAGSSVLYKLAERYGHELVTRFGVYLHVDEKKLILIEKKFKQYGPWVIIIGRHIPGFRIPITIFSGMSKVGYRTFIISTLVSVIIWIPVNLAIGERLGSHTVRLLHTHPEFFYVASIPFIVFIISIIIIKLKQTKKHGKR